MDPPGTGEELGSAPAATATAPRDADRHPPGTEAVGAPASSRRDPRQFRELVLYLAKRELTTKHRWTVLGWAWPLTRQLVQLGILVLVFTTVFDLGIEDFPVFVFIGLIAFTWFSAAMTDAASSLLSKRQLVFQPGIPTAVLPVVAVAVPFIDVLMAAPVLAVMVVFSGELQWTALFVPVAVAVQFLLMCGFAWLVAAATVYLRDVPHIVGVGLTMLFYLTPIFYPYGKVPEDYRWLLRLNPMTTLIEWNRDAVMYGKLPGLGQVALLTLAAAAIAALGIAFFRRLQSGFVDEL